MSVAAVVLTSKTLSTHGIVQAQGGFANWNLVATGVVPFFVFLIAATAETNRPPFDLVEAEQELVGGFQTEYSSIRFGLFYVAEFMNNVTMSAIIVTLFLGGPRGPLVFGPDWIWPPIWFVVKLVAFLFLQTWIRATLPRLRYDQLMQFGWKVLIPVSFGWLLLITAMRLGNDQDWNLALVGGLGFVVLLACWGLLSLAFRSSARNRQLEGTRF
jgi:NADH-quinone oxidoreductase subunit H